MQNPQNPSLIIFADGASSGNPGPGGWGAILISTDIAGAESILEIGGADPQTTNNRMELTAVIAALHLVRKLPQLIRVYTDSTYVINGIQRWIHGWRSRGWMTAEGKPVANQDLWELLSKASTGHEIEWCYVPGHAGIVGNERADEIAVGYSQKRPPTLFKGPLTDYSHALFPLPDPKAPAKKPAGSKKEVSKKAHSYLSLLGSTPMRHSTWSECEKRVKGQSAARFRKAMNPAEEVEILLSWGFKPGDVK